MSVKLSTLRKRFDLLTARIAAIAKVQEELTTITAAIAAAEAGASTAHVVDSGLPVGTVVAFNYGRAETRKQLTGVVLATKTQEKGPTLYRITVGEGFDAQTYTVQANAIVSHNFELPTPVGAEVTDDVTPTREVPEYPVN